MVFVRIFLWNMTWKEGSASWKLSLSFGVFLDPSVFLEFSPPHSFLIFQKKFLTLLVEFVGFYKYLLIT